MITIVKAEREDIPLLTEMRLSYLSEDPGFHSEEEKADIARRLPLYFEKHLNNDLHCWLAKEGDRAVSSAFLLITEKPASPSFPGGLTGTVLNVFTKESHRHQGYAGKIMKQLLQEAETQKLSAVELKATMDGIHLYETLGFKDASAEYLLMKWKPEKK
jgi:GNAT superfamily N-acetyltransferase